MKKKIFLLILLTFLLCGCTANVNITINDNTISERISIQEAPYGELTMNDITQQYRKYIPAFKDTIIVDTMPDVKEEGVKYYQSSSSETNGVFNVHYLYDYNFGEYQNSTGISNSFKSPIVQYDSNEKKITIKTADSEMILFSSYPELDEVKINITTNYKVLENNADYNSGNVYTWIYRKGTNKGIYLLLEDLEGKCISKDNKTDKEDKDNKDNSNESNEDKDNHDEKNNRDDVEKSTLEKGYDKFKEEGNKHPHILAFVFTCLFLLVVIISFRVKKV